MPVIRSVPFARTIRWAVAILLIVAVLAPLLSLRPTPTPLSTLQAITQGSALGAAASESSEIGLEGWIVALAGDTPVAGAKVALAEGIEARSDASGYFSFTREQVESVTSDLDAGYAEVTVSVLAEGFADWTITGTRYYPGDTLRLYPRLASASNESVAVTAAPRSPQRTRGSGADGIGIDMSGALSLGADELSMNAANASAAAPPATIRVFRTATGQVEVIPFREYVKHVLPAEWIPTWGAHALRAGAMAVKSYAWYWISRGGKHPSLGADMRDDVNDQVYDPNLSYASTDAAVDATFDYMLSRNGALFQTQYCAGSYSGEANGACPWPAPYMTQWGSAYHADQGRTWGWILQYYYPGATISPAPPGGGYDGTPYPTSPPRPPAATATPVVATTYTVGQGSAQAALFQEAYDRNGGVAVLGRPTGPVRWWLPYVSEFNVVAQPFSGPNGRGNVWIVYDVLKAPSQGVSKAFLLNGAVAAAYASNTPQGPEWVGAPTSDPYVSAADRGAAPSQGFTRGTMVDRGQSVEFVPWPTQFAGWKAEFFVGHESPAVQAGPSQALPGQPAFVRDLPTADFDFTTAPALALSMGVGKRDWSAQLTRQVTVADGTYDFTLSTDGGVRLWIDGLLAVNGWQDRLAMETMSYSADLYGGEHTIRVQYYSIGAGGKLRLAFSPRSQPAAPPAPPPAATAAPAPPAPPVAVPPPAGSAALRVQVQWIGRQRPPSDSWAQPLTLRLANPADAKVLGTYKGTTDRNGVAFYQNLPAGTYNVHVKGPHSLQAARANIVLQAGTTINVDMKVQVEGDLDGDNCVTVNDMAVVQSMLGTHKEIPGFNPSADLNNDGIVTMADISLLRSGFDLCGDVSADNEFRAMSTNLAPPLSQTLAPWLNPSAMQHTLSYALSPSSPSVRVGETVKVDVMAEAGTQPIDGASFLLRYDPQRFALVDGSGNPATRIEPGYLLPAVMGNWVDASGGAIGYSAGMLQGSTPSGRIVVASVRLRALPGVGSGPALISFAPLPSPYVQLTNGGENLLAKASDLTLTVVP